MSRFSFSSLSFRMTALVLVVITPALALTLYTILMQRQIAIAHVRQEAMTMVRIADDDYRRLIDETHQLLFVLSRIPEADGDDAKACARLFSDLLTRQPIYSNFAATRNDGEVICSALPLSSSVNAANELYFQRTVSTRDFSIGDYEVCPITNKPSIHFGYPISDETTGEVKGVIVADLDLTRLNQLGARDHLPEGWTATVRDRNGTVLIRSSGSQGQVGEPAPDPSALAAMNGRSKDGIVEAVDANGIKRIYAFTPLHTSSDGNVLYLSVDIPEALTLPEVRSTLVYNLLGLVLVVMPALLGIWKGSNRLILRRVKDLVDTAQQLQAGNLGVRTMLPPDGGELSDLALAFDRMAETLEQREGQLRQAEQFNKEIMESAGEGIVVYDRSLMYVAWNRFMEGLTGLAAGDVIGRYALDVYPYLREYGTEKLIRKAMAGETLISADMLFHVSKSPDPIWISVTYGPHRNANGEIVGVIGLVRDITQRKEWEERLHESEERYRNLVESARDAIFSISLDGRFLSINPAFEIVTGWPCGEWIGQPFEPILHPDDMSLGVEKFQCAISGEVVPVYELRVRSKSSGYIFTELTVSQQVKEGKIAGVFGIARDVTERKRAREERNRLAAAIQQAVESVMITDRKGTIEYVNPAFERITGYGREEIIGKDWRVLRSGRHDEAFYRERQETLDRGEVWKGHIIKQKKDGSLCEVETTISPIRDDTGTTINFVAVGRDVTQEVKLEKKLRQAQKLEAIGTLAGGIAHDFNNILTAILGYTEMAMDMAEGEQRRKLHQVLNAGFRARDLVKQILAFSRQGDQERSYINISPVIKEALKLLRASLPSTIEIHQNIAVASDRDVVLADPTQIHQVLMNLCTNASHAMKGKGGVLEVNLIDLELDCHASEVHPDLNPGPYLRLTVSDTGHGMDQKTLDRIFDPFFTTKEMGEGTGLGLAVVHGIVQGHRGAIIAYSKPGQGTTFNVFLPRCGPAAEVMDTDSVEPLPRGSERILFVDDEVVLVELAQDRLEQLGYEVVARACPGEALELFRSKPASFDLVISDLTMPGLTGVDLAREILLIRPDMPIILCTGFSEMITPERARTMGIRKFLMKPIVLREMAINIRCVLDGTE